MHTSVPRRPAGSFTRAAFGLLATLLALVTAGCEQQTGIFASIERETEIANRNLSKTAGVSNVVKLDDTYYAAIGSVWSLSYEGGSAADEWNAVGFPDDAPNGTALAIAVLDAPADEPGLYGAFAQSDGTNLGLYRLSDDGSSWNKPDNVYDEGPITDLFAFDTDDDGETDQLVAASPTDGVTSGVTLVFTPQDTGVAAEAGPVNPIIDAAYDGGNGSYWFLSKSYLFRGTDSGSIARVDFAGDETILNDITEFAGIHSADGDIYISTAAGSVYRRIGGSWEDRETAPGDPTPALDDLVVVPAVGGGSSETLYISARTNSDGTGGGYFTASPASDGALSRPSGDDSYTSADLSEAEVRGFYVFEQSFAGDDGTGRLLFAATANSGLWSKAFTSSGGAQDWRWE